MMLFLAIGDCELFLGTSLDSDNEGIATRSEAEEGSDDGDAPSRIRTDPLRNTHGRRSIPALYA